MNYHLFFEGLGMAYAVHLISYYSMYGALSLYDWIKDK